MKWEGRESPTAQTRRLKRHVEAAKSRLVVKAAIPAYRGTQKARICRKETNVTTEEHDSGKVGIAGR